MEKFKYFLTKVLKRWQIVLFSILFIFLGSYLTFEGINYLNEKCLCEFSTQINIDIDSFFTYEKLSEIKSKNEKYESVDIKSISQEKGLTIKEVDEDTYLITSYSRYYQSFLSSSTTKSKSFLNEYLATYIGKDNITFSNKEIIQTIDYLNSYLWSAMATLISLIPLTVIIGLPKEKEQKDFYDNEETFKTPFHKQYWTDSLSFLKNTKSITTLSMLFALMLASKLITLPSGFGNLGLSFAYLFFSTIGLIYGPIAGLLIGFLSDILGFFIFDASGESFFIGYAFQAMITGFIYGIMFYRTKISFKRILIARVLVSVIANILIGSFCYGFIKNFNFYQTLLYMITLSLPKNILFLIPQSLLLFIVFKGVIPILSKFKYIDPKIEKNITLI